MVFRLPVFYNQQPPDILSGVITVQKHRNTNLTMLSHRNKWATTAPNPIPWIQFLLYQKFLIQSNNSFAKSTTYRTLDGSRPIFRKKINPPFGGLNFLAERIGLEPMDQKFRSQISNLLHYHSANAPCWVIISVQHIKIKGKFSVFLTNLSYIKKSPFFGDFFSVLRQCVPADIFQHHASLTRICLHDGPVIQTPVFLAIL